MNTKHFIILFASMLLIALAGCAGEQSSKEDPKEIPITPEARTIINTKLGDLTLSYKEGKAIIQGILQRSTPCVNWDINAEVMESFPEQVRYSIIDTSTAEMCVQMLGEPQDVYAEAQVSEQAKITVLLKEEIVFEGQLG